MEFNFKDVAKRFYEGKVKVLDGDFETQSIYTVPQNECLEICDLSYRYSGETVYGVVRVLHDEDNVATYKAYPVHGPLGTMLVCQDILTRRYASIDPSSWKNIPIPTIEGIGDKP